MRESTRNRRNSALSRAARGTLVAVLIGASGCMTAYKKSVGASTLQNFNRVYVTDFDTAWQAVLDAMKSIRLDVTNREAGFLQSRWMDNTREKNFSDGDGSTAPYMRAQYRFKVSVAKGVYNRKNAIKITVQREQFAQRDALDDFHPLESDSIEENTLLYRIGRIISIRTRLARLEEARTKAEIQKAATESAAPAEAPATDDSAPAESDVSPESPASSDSGGTESLDAPEIPPPPASE
jgi:hypothetical protein